MSVASALSQIKDGGVDVVVAMPDSLLAPLSRAIATDSRFQYIQTMHEATAIGIAAGLTLCGKRAIVLMENSGLRAAADTLARLGMAQGLGVCCLISHRGALGERHWWAIRHHDTMVPLLELLDFRYESITTVDNLGDALRRTFDTLAAGQTHVALVAERSFLKEIAE